MRRKRSVIGYNIETGERKEWCSLNQAAEELGTAYSYLSHLLHRKAASVKGWCLAYPDCEADAVSLYENGGKKERRRSERKRSSRTIKNPGKNLVPLRINDKLTIWVKPEDATKEFAEEYMRMLEENR